MANKIEFFWNLVAVEKLNKSESKKGSGLFVEEMEIADDFGIVRYIGSKIENAPFAVGDKVYIGKTRQELRMAGVDMMVMEASNVFARVTEETVTE